MVNKRAIEGLLKVDYMKNDVHHGAVFAEAAESMVRGKQVLVHQKNVSEKDRREQGAVPVLNGAITLGKLMALSKNTPFYKKMAAAKDEGLQLVLDFTEENRKRKTVDVVSDLSRDAVDDDALEKEDIALINKIRASVVRPPCGGFRTFRDYIGGAEFERNFQVTVLKRFLYKNFKAEHKELEGTMLFGPPGTGKTFLAEAVAAELQKMNCVFYSLSASDIKSRYVGDNEKGIKFLFREARLSSNSGQKPVVIFIDEIDGLVSEGSGESGSSGLLSELNKQMQGLGSNNEGLIVIGATNYPEKIPSAAVSRFKNKIFVGLPTLDDIRQLLLLNLRKAGETRVNMQIDWERKIHILSDPDLQNTTGPGEPNSRWDEIDMLAVDMYDKGYASREIDGVISIAKAECETRSLEFVEGGDGGSAQYQLWICDTRRFPKWVDENGQCKYRSAEEVPKKQYLIPVGFTNFNNDRNPAGVPQALTTVGVTTVKKYVNGVLVDSDLINPKAEINLVMTERTLIVTPEDSRWRYNIIKKNRVNNDAVVKDSAGRIIMDKYDPRPDEAIGDNMAAVLGLAQFTLRDFTQALKQIKPPVINNVKQLAKYALENGSSMKPNNEDVTRLQDQAANFIRPQDENTISTEQIASFVKVIADLGKA